MSITLRICLIFLFVSALGFYFFARQEIGDTTQRYREATEEPLVDFATVLAEIVARQSEASQLRTDFLRQVFSTVSAEVLSAQIYNLLKTNVDTRVYVTDAKGIVVFDSAGRDEGKDYSRWNDIRQTLAGGYGARTSHDDPTHSGSVLYVAAPVKVGGRLIGVLTVAKPNENANRFIDVAKANTLVLGFVSFFTVAGLAVILSLIVTRPIYALTNYAREVRDGKRTTLPKLSGSELQMLGGAFEEMREALEGRKYVEQYVQTLTHEIKSPLTAIRGAIELLKEDPPLDVRLQFMHNIDRETSRAQDLVNKLLSLSALQRKNALDRAETFSLPSLVRKVLDSERPRAEMRGIIFELAAPDEIMIEGDKFWLEEALANVVQNALEFSPRDSRVVVGIHSVPDSTAIEFRDHGPGVPDWALAKIFDQFYSLPRPDTGKRSSGLGLTIVREVAELHGGTVTLENQSEGGVLVRMTLPLRLRRA